ncbi:MAG: DUF4258 domain-containing protein [Oscillospiraceae bacterium]|nr:DUF4258 domain-containing protein [Oscillospiraceae bacterium]
MLEIKQIQELYQVRAVELTDHYLNMLVKRSISFDDVRSAILSGIIIEQYPDDYPYPSCLILGYAQNEPLHIVAGLGNDKLWIITTYKPDVDKWEDDFKTRKAAQ